MGDFHQLVVFNLDDHRYALRLHAVERVVPVVEINPLPVAPQIVLGIINVQGQVVPVVDIRKRFNLPEREINLGDHLIIARTARRTVAFIADATTGVVERSGEEITALGGVLSNLEYIEGVIKLEDGLILIHNLDTFLSLDEEGVLEQAMISHGGDRE